VRGVQSPIPLLRPSQMTCRHRPTTLRLEPHSVCGGSARSSVWRTGSEPMAADSISRRSAHRMSPDAPTAGQQPAASSRRKLRAAGGREGSGNGREWLREHGSTATNQLISEGAAAGSTSWTARLPSLGQCDSPSSHRSPPIFVATSGVKTTGTATGTFTGTLLQNNAIS
jgi:hypothetical protein